MKKQLIFEKKAYHFALLAFVLFTLLFSGCGGGSASSGSNAGNAAAADGGTEKTYYDVKLADVTSTTLTVLYLADDLGYFEEFGVNPVWVGTVASGQQVASVLSGDLNVGGGHANRLIAGIASGAKLKAVVAASETTEAIPHMKFLALEDSGLNTAEDVLGKKIGIATVGGCNEYTTYEYLKKELGIEDPRELINYVILPAGTEETALRNGDVDIIGLHGDPVEVINRGGVKVLYTDYEVWGGDGGATPYYFSTEFIEKNPEAVHGFVSAVAKAGNWLNENPEEAQKLFAERVGLDPKEVLYFYYSPDGIIRPETIDIWNGILLEYGEIKESVPLEQVYTNEFNDLAK
ncbi:MAG: ABC transporter substrate-binding protein [Clostridiales Family XIII bacterium]|jgi:ABC-type nitrate/sulfonate/bicarbonate transport system substrate-binding protein|nr:ABC transporter substrate-binding protein [Clostridiales Family XIII bacterium]